MYRGEQTETHGGRQSLHDSMSNSCFLCFWFLILDYSSYDQISRISIGSVYSELFFLITNGTASAQAIIYNKYTHILKKKIVAP